MPFNTVPGEGTDLQVKLGTPTPAYVTVGEVVSIGGPKQEVPAVDAFHLKSTFRKKRPSRIPDQGTLEMSIFYDPNDANCQTLRSRVQQPATTDDQFQLVFNDGHTTPANETFTGFITSWELNGMEVDSNLGADITIQINSLTTPTPGS